MRTLRTQGWPGTKGKEEKSAHKAGRTGHEKALRILATTHPHHKVVLTILAAANRDTTSSSLRRGCESAREHTQTLFYARSTYIRKARRIHFTTARRGSQGRRTCMPMPRQLKHQSTLPAGMVYQGSRGWWQTPSSQLVCWRCRTRSSPAYPHRSPRTLGSFAGLGCWRPRQHVHVPARANLWCAPCALGKCIAPNRAGRSRVCTVDTAVLRIA